jgi:3-deoxy-D-manno-octulosonate 8-phosphate phosphatase (KDO 8-P phosphatase)
MKENFKVLLKNVKCIMLDVDGVLTNGSLIVMPDELYRIMNIRDGFALKTAVDAGFKVAVISGGRSESVRVRLEKLGISEIYLGVDYKIDTMKEVLKKFNITAEEVLYMGDDLPDYEVMKTAGVPCCPADAASDIKNISMYVSHAKGGEGCVRDVIEQLLRINGKWPVQS